MSKVKKQHAIIYNCPNCNCETKLRFDENGKPVLSIENPEPETIETDEPESTDEPKETSFWDGWKKFFSAEVD